MRGYPGSGKSSEAWLLVNATGAIRVCRDDIRKMLLDTDFTGKRADEERVTVVERGAVVAALQHKFDVVIDATHLNPMYLAVWQKLAEIYGAEFVVHDVPTPMAECIMRDFERGQKGGRRVGAKIIEAIARRWPIEDWKSFNQSEGES